MNILGIETATRSVSVAVIFDRTVAAEICRSSPQSFSETLLPQVESVIKFADAFNRLDAVAVSLGAGSFTGLRIGLATAKAVAYAWNLKIIGVPTLQALAYNFPNAKVLPLIDAQKNRAYFQKFKSCKPISEIEVKNIDEIVASAGEIDSEVFLCGEVLNKIKVDLPPNVKIAPINCKMPRAVNVAMCGKDLIDAGEISNVMNIEPLYIRRSEAEELWERRQK